MNSLTDIQNECAGTKADGDDNDEADAMKRKTRNMNEKKRRDQFNTAIAELSDVVSPGQRKMDKCTVLKTAINIMHSHNENVVRSKEFELDEGFKPSYMTNEEYSALMLRSMDGFFIVFTLSGKMLYASDSLNSLLGYQWDEVSNQNFYDMVSDDDRSRVKNLLFVSTIDGKFADKRVDPLNFTCKFLNKSASCDGDIVFEQLKFNGNTAQNVMRPCEENERNSIEPDSLLFIGTARLLRLTHYPESMLYEHERTEFVSHHDFEWKFLFLDESASSIVGYSPSEVLGTSGYDYYHVDDLENISAHHKALIRQDEITSGLYRFLTKGHKWIWLQTTSYINREQGDSRVESIICFHKVIHSSALSSDAEAEGRRFNRSTSSSSFGTDGSTSPTPSSSTSLKSSREQEFDFDLLAFLAESDPLHSVREKYYPDENSVTPSASSQECLNRKRKMSSADCATTSSDPSDSPCFQRESDTGYIQYKRVISLDYRSSGTSGYWPNAAVFGSLERRCSELQRTIADWTEELRIASEELQVARGTTQRNIDAQHKLEKDTEELERSAMDT